MIMSTNYNLLENILQEFCDKERVEAVLNELREESAKDKKLARKRVYTHYNEKVGTKERLKGYYQENKEGISQKKNSQIKCEVCFREVLKNNISRHKKSKSCVKEGMAIALLVEQEKELREARESDHMSLEDKY